MKYNKNYTFNNLTATEEDNLTLLNDYALSLKEDPEKYLNELAILSTFTSILQKDITVLIKKTKEISYKNVILVGIGGSSMGVKAVWDFLGKNSTKKLTVLDTVNTDLLTSLKDSKEFTPENAVVIFVSKSGTTLESIVNLEILNQYGYLTQDRFFAVVSENSDIKDSLTEVSKNIYYISEYLSGRYSIFSWVGILPLTLLGIDTKDFLQSAEETLKSFYRDIKSSEAIETSVMLHRFFLEQRYIYNNFSLDPTLNSLMFWYRQLYSESVGKDANRYQSYFMPNIATADYHSVLQMYFASPKNQIFSFLSTPINTEPIKITDPRFYSNLDTQTTSFIYETLNISVAKTADELSIPCIDISINKTERDLAHFLVTKILEVMFLCRLLGVNAFNQPNIESYKKNAKNIIESN